MVACLEGLDDLRQGLAFGGRGEPDPQQSGTPADVADVIAFLAGDTARWITGQNLNATGGVI
ncbi:SDR family oxidoreductase [Nonomuraea angiospora]|uniref:NAD(P)-dependent dehydrogenase (Short-subunit alcohol dehydrogenase family) n=1 Tax=Nonomuraea angiospora TaxID=46172 RepID=A0ABR9LTS9_9ACTN|nr:SDR family oxidoreductase [Nonomuraea angiospora]MBE1584064.1 NAD(P)-dependent dehydrogenase (short-subunit alcohol dehydrogenase family) [Nonomuraea angiospora]